MHMDVILGPGMYPSPPPQDQLVSNFEFCNEALGSSRVKQGFELMLSLRRLNIYIFCNTNECITMSIQLAI